MEAEYVKLSSLPGAKELLEFQESPTEKEIYSRVRSLVKTLKSHVESDRKKRSETIQKARDVYKAAVIVAKIKYIQSGREGAEPLFKPDYQEEDRKLEEILGDLFPSEEFQKYMEALSLHVRHRVVLGDEPQFMTWCLVDELKDEEFFPLFEFGDELIEV